MNGKIHVMGGRGDHKMVQDNSGLMLLGEEDDGNDMVRMAVRATRRITLNRAAVVDGGKGMVLLLSCLCNLVVSVKLSVFSTFPCWSLGYGFSRANT